MRNGKLTRGAFRTLLNIYDGVFCKNKELRKVADKFAQSSLIVLTDFQLFRFCTPWKYLKTGGFLIFSGGIEVEHWLKMS